MSTLDDLFYFDAVVRYGGFAAAGRALDIPKSKLSRRVSGLEERLEVRLLERSARRFSLTAVGEAFHVHCRAALDEAAAAEEMALRLKAEPRGLVRVGCPPGFGEHALAKILPAFFAAYPKVRVQILVSMKPVDLIAERVDVVIRANLAFDHDQDLIARKLGAVGIVLVASPAFLERHGNVARPEDLSQLPTISYPKASDQDLWILYDESEIPARVRHQSQVIADDFAVLRAAALEGIGVAMLPQAVCLDALTTGRLVRVLPAYHAGESMMHVLFTSRRGMLPAVRVLVNHLIAELPTLMRTKREQA
ncbi:MAG TPA: LysR family transcriptional regulator [Aurantimonas coralicida]|uniref:LysR family transcriptional regulator n=2 Tax=root TaxID=1 RepID=A0A9C9NK85_9HYPH|nr:LysR family transcriptional regulator [Aurantimonas coralicida]HEU03131.1 LysR family transcriptional regulator [Aurantimonas coralicida]